MKLWTRWRTRRRERIAAEAERAAREHDAAEAEAARQRVLDLARRQRYDRDHDSGHRTWSWNGPTLILDLPLLTYGQSRLYRVGSC